MEQTTPFREPRLNQIKMPPPKDLINISGIPKDALRKELLEALKSSIIKEDKKEFLKDHRKLSWFIDEGLRYAVKVYIKPKDFVDASGLGERCDADTVREVVKRLRQDYPLGPSA
ncbi:unnamed protein product [Aspergillus oryzae]|nr:unnamed protein product [Aspergillus oryzae]